MTKVGIIGASGMAGSAIYKLAEKNDDLKVTGIIRNEAKAKKVLGDQANLLVGDVLTMDEKLLADFDVIVDAFGTAPAQAADQTKLAKKLVEIARKNKQRLIIILGAGSLHTGDDNHLFVEDIAKLPDSDAWINTPRQQLNELNYLKEVNDVDWLGISPSMTFEAGPASDGYILGKDNLLYNDKHESKTTSGTMAELVVSEIVKPEHSKERIAVANK
ncbi:NAD(P)H-binding protein [uncultured Lactobacillus sp.]|uniref:NAD(P)-dependent oxidoreductase n=1 Tax=uncultured Lactobacillus sp. TaxID=153152 RepID=UPI00280625AF|nr:NAD(P)H-binding protein [uncultured Lactobacillus sp.]